MDHATYEPLPVERFEPANATLRTALAVDLPAMCAIRAQHMPGPHEQHLDFFERVQRRCAKNGYPAFWSALDAGEVVGYSRLLRFDQDHPDVLEWIEREAPGTIPPSGWYLMGVNVLRSARRRGIGSKLTEVRLRYAFERTEEVLYFTNELNLPSVDLHRPWGFVEVRRGFDFPGLTFEGGGEGLLFGCTRRAFLAAVEERPG